MTDVAIPALDRDKLEAINSRLRTTRLTDIEDAYRLGHAAGAARGLADLETALREAGGKSYTLSISHSDGYDMCVTISTAADGGEFANGAALKPSLAEALRAALEALHAERAKAAGHELLMSRGGR